MFEFKKVDSVFVDYSLLYFLAYSTRFIHKITHYVLDCRELELEILMKLNLINAGNCRIHLFILLISEVRAAARQRNYFILFK